MALLRVFLFISIIAPVIINAYNIKYYNEGPSVRMWCKPNQLIKVVRAQIVVEKPLGSKQRNIFETLPLERTQEIKDKCQYKQLCEVDLDIRINKNIYLDIEFQCITDGCPHWTFIRKHIVRFENDPSDAQLARVAREFEIKRVKYGWQLTDVMNFYADPIEFMEYHKSGETTCAFKTAAKKYQCVKRNNNWNCQRFGTTKAIHNTMTGHLEGEIN